MLGITVIAVLFFVYKGGEIFDWFKLAGGVAMHFLFWAFVIACALWMVRGCA